MVCEIYVMRFALKLNLAHRKLNDAFKRFKNTIAAAGNRLKIGHAHKIQFTLHGWNTGTVRQISFIVLQNPRNLLQRFFI